MAKSRARRCEDAIETIRAALDGLESVKDEYQEWRDNLPENLDSSPVAEKLDTAIETLEQIQNDIESACDESDSIEWPLGFGRD